MQIGSRSRPAAANWASFSRAAGRRKIAVGAVGSLCNRVDLRLDRCVERIEVVERGRLLGGGDHRLGEGSRALAAAFEALVHLGGVGPVLEREAADQLDLLLRRRRGSG